MIEVAVGAQEVPPRRGSWGAEDVLMPDIFRLFCFPSLALLRIVFGDNTDGGIAVGLRVHCI